MLFIENLSGLIDNVSETMLVENAVGVLRRKASVPYHWVILVCTVGSIAYNVCLISGYSIIILVAMPVPAKIRHVRLDNSADLPANAVLVAYQALSAVSARHSMPPAGLMNLPHGMRSIQDIQDTMPAPRNNLLSETAKKFRPIGMRRSAAALTGTVSCCAQKTKSMAGKGGREYVIVYSVSTCVIYSKAHPKEGSR